MAPNKGTTGSDYDLLLDTLAKPAGLEAYVGVVNDAVWGETPTLPMAIIPGSVPKAAAAVDVAPRARRRGGDAEGGGSRRQARLLLEIKTHRLIRRAASLDGGWLPGQPGGGAEVVGQGASLLL